MADKNTFFSKFREAAASVLPIILIVVLVCLLWVPVSPDLMLSFLLGALFLILGMGLFTVGSEISMTLIGSHIGSWMTRTRKPALILIISFLLGTVISISEPDLQVLAANVPEIRTSVLVVVVSIGVGLFLMISMIRILYALPLRLLLTVCYLLVLGLALLSDRHFIAVAFDSGGVTTGPMTVPFIMAIGTGVASIRSDARAQQDSFGLVGLCSIGPILAVLILGFIYQPTAEATAAGTISRFQDTVALGHGYLRFFPVYLKEVGIAMLPVLLSFVVFQSLALRFPKAVLFRAVTGFFMTFGGLTLFLTGANVGFSSLGYILGEHLSDERQRYLLIPFSMLMGWFIINAEPAVHVLTKQVEELSAGVISTRSMRISLSAAVSLAMGLGMLRILTGISILWIVVPGYLFSLLLSFLVPHTFTAIAFDSGGVASGPLIATFMLPLAMGAVTGTGGNLMASAFGLVALVAMMPLITIQLMGVFYRFSSRRAAVSEEPQGSHGETEIIELWEV